MRRTPGRSRSGHARHAAAQAVTRSARGCAAGPSDGRPTLPSESRLSGAQVRITRRQAAGRSTRPRTARRGHRPHAPPSGVRALARFVRERGTRGCARGARSAARSGLRARGRPVWRGAGASGLVERVRCSDMLPKPYKAGISRGFEFSATCIRRRRPACETRAIRAWRAAGSIAGRALRPELDAVRIPPHDGVSLSSAAFAELIPPPYPGTARSLARQASDTAAAPGRKRDPSDRIREMLL